MKASIAAFLLLCTTAVGCRRGDEEDPKPVVAVKVARAEVANVPLTVEAPAAIFGKSQANISARITAPIRRLGVRKGDDVKAGQLLAVLESTDLQAQQAEALAAQTDAEASMQKTKNGTLPTDIQRARSELIAKEAALTLAQKIYDRRGDLYRQGAISARELQTSEAARAEAKANYDVARLDLDLLEHQTSRNDLEIAQSRVAQSKAHHALADADLSFSELKSPIKGTITEQFMYPGDMAKPELPLFTVVDLSAGVARAQVPESQAGQIARGQACTFTGPDPSTAALTGKITLINQAVDPARRTVEVWCEIANPNRVLKAGVFGKVTIVVGTAAHAVVVPQTAVQFQEGSTQGKVYVVDQQHVAHLREVEAAPINGGSVRIAQGIAAGETVIVEGGYGLPDGTKVDSSGGTR
jgi:HlyD family secretion protein